MSYSGYDELLCESGHYLTEDAMAWRETRTNCVHCDKPFVYTHPVDQTNGYDTSEEWSCNAPKEIIGSDDIQFTDHYGNKYFTKRLRYKPGKHWRSC